jgi:hypothetical protein
MFSVRSIAGCAAFAAGVRLPFGPRSTKRNRHVLYFPLATVGAENALPTGLYSPRK